LTVLILYNNFVYMRKTSAKKTNFSKAVFIDRDGTIARDVPYCSRPEDFELFPGVPEAIRTLNRKNFKVVVITNQSGIARGYFSEPMLALIHEKMICELAKQKAHIDAVYYCPHHPDDKCNCRKPQTAMVIKAANDLNIDLSESYMIGDTEMDCEMAASAGCRAAIKIGDPGPTIAKHCAPTFEEAVAWITKQRGHH
jgi:D,D-heptose 1,7-bisphosphate phosphatase